MGEWHRNLGQSPAGPAAGRRATGAGDDDATADRADQGDACRSKRCGDAGQDQRQQRQSAALVPRACRGELWRHKARSEEHTSELQSLMRTSYAVFCLKKKKKKNTTTNTRNTNINTI